MFSVHVSSESIKRAMRDVYAIKDSSLPPLATIMEGNSCKIILTEDFSETRISAKSHRKDIQARPIPQEEPLRPIPQEEPLRPIPQEKLDNRHDKERDDMIKAERNYDKRLEEGDLSFDEWLKNRMTSIK